ncbi:MAG: TcpE family conjugal transfer membrane protein, partial [Acidimicrobiales bacterium]
MPTERPTPAHIEIDLPVYTGIFHLQRRLYRVYDVELPMPVSFPQAVAFLAVGSLMFIGLRAAGVELSPGTAWAFLVPPGLAAWLANRPVADQRSPLQWAVAQVRYLVEPRAITGLKPERVPRSQRMSVAVWEPRQR